MSLNYHSIQFVQHANAQEVAAQADEAAAQPAWMSFLPLVLIIAIFYFLMIRPQNKRYKQYKEMLSALNKGDDVVTQGGLIGKIIKIDEQDDILHVELGSQIVVKVKRQGIAERIAPNTPDNKKAA